MFRIQSNQVEELDQYMNDGDTEIIVESDDFVCGGHPTTGSPTLTNGVVFGKMGWRAASLGTGVVSLVTSGQDIATRGVLQLFSGSSSTSFAGAFRGPSGPTASTLLGNNQKKKKRFRFKIPVLSDSTNTFLWRMGLFATETVTLNDGLYFEASAPTNPNWIGATAKGGVVTLATPGTPVSVASGVGNFIEATIEVDLIVTDTISFFIGTTLIGTIPNAHTVIPTVALAEAYMNAWVKGGGGNVWLDDWWQKLTYSPPRAAEAP